MLCVSEAFFFLIAEENSVVWTDHGSSDSSLTEGHSGWLQFEAITNKHLRIGFCVNQSLHCMGIHFQLLGHMLVISLVF